MKYLVSTIVLAATLGSALAAPLPPRNFTPKSVIEQVRYCTTTCTPTYGGGQRCTTQCY